MIKMNKKDILILTNLRKNARMPLTKMSRETQIPVSTLFDRLKAKEKEFILKHTSLINFTKLGYHTRANILIKVDRDDKESLREFLLNNSSTNSIYRVNNGFDFMIEVIFKQIKDLEEFLEIVDNKFKIENRKSYFIIEDIKKEEFMSDPNML
ncbi:MAG: Lrp/AsnC family transcriptional regulator [Candidatus Woesearchaeota archaeon]